MKTCGKCGFTGPEDQFEAGRRHRCLSCRDAYNTAYYAKTAEVRREKGRGWHAENRERSRAQAKAWKEANRERYLRGLKARSVERHYGISLDAVFDTIEAQHSCCPICKLYYPANEYKRWHVDHCHTTGRVRGVICSYCNLMLGHAKDNPDTLKRAASYLKGKL